MYTDSREKKPLHILAGTSLCHYIIVVHHSGG